MSDISDVLLVLAQQVAAVCYPSLTFDEIARNWDSQEFWDKTDQQSITGKDIRIYPGWPVSNGLDDDLAAGLSHISVFPQASERNTTRYQESDIITAAPAPTITFSSAYLVQPVGNWDAGLWDATGDWDGFSNTIITLGGSVTVPQNLALRINGKFYVYSVQAGDTLASIASALATLVSPTIPGTSASGAVLTVGPSGNVEAARAGGFGTVAREVRRQERVVQITFWCPNPADRDALVGPVDAALAATHFLTMPDGFAARLIYKNSPVTDALQKGDLYRRDLLYTVEYATTTSQQAAAVIAPSVTINSALTETY